MELVKMLHAIISINYELLKFYSKLGVLLCNNNNTDQLLASLKKLSKNFNKRFYNQKNKLNIDSNFIVIIIHNTYE